MKNLFIAVALFVTLAGFSGKKYVTIGRVETAGRLEIELIYQIQGVDTIYTINFRNENTKKPEIKSLSFTGSECLNKIHGSISSAFKEKYFEQVLIVDGKEIRIGRMNSHVMLFMDYSHCTISRNMVEKIFGKRKNYLKNRI